MSLCQVVDEQDNIVGHKERHKIDFVNDIYRISALWLTNSSGQILLAQRLKTKDKDPGKWGPAVAGTLEKGETYESNMYKEAEEEVGLVGIKLKKGIKQRFYVPRQAFCQWFNAVVDWPAEKFTPQPSEVERVAWFSLDEIKKDLESNPDKYVPSMKSIIENVADV